MKRSEKTVFGVGLASAFATCIYALIPYTDMGVFRCSGALHEELRSTNGFNPCVHQAHHRLVLVGVLLTVSVALALGAWIHSKGNDRGQRAGASAAVVLACAVTGTAVAAYVLAAPEGSWAVVVPAAVVGSWLGPWAWIRERPIAAGVSALSSLFAPWGFVMYGPILAVVLAVSAARRAHESSPKSQPTVP